MSGAPESIALPQDPATLIESLRAEIERLKHHIHVLQLELFGRGREKLAVLPPYPENGPRQLYLPFAEEEGLVAKLAQDVAQRAEQRASAASGEANGKKKGHGRRAEFPKNAPVYTTVIDLEEQEKTCACGTALTEMAPEVRIELERVEFSVIHRIERKKYACRPCEGVIEVAPSPPQVFDRGLLGPSFLSWLATERFGQHMPYHRLEKKLRGEGFSIARSLMCENIGRLADLLAPIYDAQLRDILGEAVIHCDDTGVTVLESKNGGASTGYVWVYCDHYGRVIYTFTERRTRDGPLGTLRGFRGYLQADAFSGFDGLYAPGEIVEVACWAHARRKFFQIENNTLAKEVVDLIGDLYAIEGEAKDHGITGDALRAMRQARAKPVLATILDWLTVTKQKVLEKSPLGKAIQYALNQWQALCRYVESGELEIDNNRAERALRVIAVGRGNWTFVGTETFGQKAAVMYSLISTCRELKLEPRVYLWDVMQRIATEKDVAKLTPMGWKQHFASDATKAWEAQVARLASATIPAAN